MRKIWHRNTINFPVWLIYKEGSTNESLGDKQINNGRSWRSFILAKLDIALTGICLQIKLLL